MREKINNFRDELLQKVKFRPNHKCFPGQKDDMIGFQIGKIMSYTALVILLLLSPSYSDQEIDKTTLKLVESSSLVPKLEEPENLKTDGADGDVGGKVILLYHPINTKSHRNQQNAIAEVSQNLTY